LARGQADELGDIAAVSTTQGKGEATMTAPQFGTVGCEIHELTEQATYVARAINTLECLGEWGVIDEADDMNAGFVRQSWAELKRLEAWFYAQGVKPRDIDLGAFV
jgi:hypothetical protein